METSVLQNLQIKKIPVGHWCREHYRRLRKESDEPEIKVNVSTNTTESADLCPRGGPIARRCHSLHPLTKGQQTLLPSASAVHAFLVPAIVIIKWKAKEAMIVKNTFIYFFFLGGGGGGGGKRNLA